MAKGMLLFGTWSGLDNSIRQIMEGRSDVSETVEAFVNGSVVGGAFALAGRVASGIRRSAAARLEAEGEPAAGRLKNASDDAVEGAGSKIKFNSLDDFINNPQKLSEATPEQFYKYFQDNGFNPQPLNDGNFKGVTFDQGGGFKINWGGDRIMQYHPAGLNHHGGEAYWKLSSGPTGTLRFDLNGNLITN
jgi:hypothetical protein